MLLQQPTFPHTHTYTQYLCLKKKPQTYFTTMLELVLTYFNLISDYLMQFIKLISCFYLLLTCNIIYIIISWD